jgi:hypothetical protein
MIWYVSVTSALVCLTFGWTSLLQAAILFGLFCVGFVLVAVHHGAQHSNQLLLLVGGRHPVKSNTQLGKVGSG